MSAYLNAVERVKESLIARGEDGATSSEITNALRGDPEVGTRAGTILSIFAKKGCADRKPVNGKTRGHQVYRYFWIGENQPRRRFKWKKIETEPIKEAPSTDGEI